MTGKLISMHGIDSSGLCLYLAKSFRTINMMVAIVDSSEENAVSGNLPIIDDMSDGVRCKGIAFYGKRKIVPLLNKYDVVIAYYGMSFDETDAIEEKSCVSLRLLIIDQQRTSINFTQKYIDKKYGNFMLIRMNYIKEEQISDIDMRIDQLLFVSETEMDCYLIPFAREDYVCFLSAQFFFSFYFDRLSERLQDLIISIVETISNRKLNKDEFNQSFQLNEN